MGDAGEGLVDANSRIQERIEEIEEERKRSRRADPQNPEELRRLESLRLQRTDLERQLAATTNPHRRAQLEHAIEAIGREMKQLAVLG